MISSRSPATLHRRLSRLESALPLRDLEEDRRRDDEAMAARDAEWEFMLSTMSPEHAGIVAAAREANAEGNFLLLPQTPERRLLHRCLNAFSKTASNRRQAPYDTIPPEVSLAMPPAVCEVYLNDPAALPLHDCEDCGYKVPHSYFERCPLCGGRVGWYAFYHKHGPQWRGR